MVGGSQGYTVGESVSLSKDRGCAGSNSYRYENKGVVLADSNLVLLRTGSEGSVRDEKAEMESELT